MTDFNLLEQNLRTWALVGRFFQEWAFVESKLGNVISKGLNLQPMQSAILEANVMFKAKIDIARTLVGVSAIHQEERRKSYTDTLEKIARFYANKRNLVAHNPFVPSEDGKRVRIYRTMAKGDLQFPKIEWSVEDFNRYFAKMDGFYRKLEALEGDVGQSALVDALMGRGGLGLGTPHEGLSWLGIAGLLNPQIQSPHDTSPSTPEKDVVTPPDLRN